MKISTVAYWVNDSNELIALGKITQKEYQIAFERAKQANPNLIYCFEDNQK